MNQPSLVTGTIAYLSMDVAIDSDIPTYSGGLGVLAGDMLRSAADLGLPMVAVTLLHRKGYFDQRLDARGNQLESPSKWSPENHLEPLPQRVSIEIEGRNVSVRAWRYLFRGITGHAVPLLLLDTDLDDEQREYAELIKKSSDSLLILINDILDLSKIKAGRMELEAIDFNIKEAVRNVLHPMQVNLKKNLRLNYTINNSVPEFVKGDSHKLFQILNNLVSNAIKFTEKGEIKVDVNVIEKNDEKVYIKLDVFDTGIGISSEHIKNIFQNFTQAGNDTVRRFGGTGLGLAITKRLVELQNGTIDIESKLGEGTVFHVEIPYITASVRQSVVPVNNKIDISHENAKIENKRILIVEDNLVNQRVLTSVLQKLKMKWDIANNGKEAIDILEKGNRYDLIVMDLQMPVMDGFQATEHIRKTIKIDTPIIAMTASTLRNERVKCLEIGMNEYLAKPFSPGDLIRHIHNLINPINLKEKQMQREMLKEKLYNYRQD